MISDKVIQLNDSDTESSDRCNGTKRRKLIVNENLHFKEKVLKVLELVTDFGPGEFAIFGRVDAPVITIAIKNVIVTFPLDESGARTVIDAFEQSSNGRGAETVADTLERNSWRVNRDGFVISNPSWNIFINEVLVPRIKMEMSIKCSYSASLHELVLHKTGSVFKPHCNSETRDGKFATLMIQLPSQYTGGEVVICHEWKKESMDFSSNDVSNAWSISFCTFYCDCQNESLPVKEGYRLCLIYNLISHPSESIPVAPRRQILETQMTSLINNWECMSKLIYALKHNYSKSNLLFENLKATDKAVASFLLHIAKASDLHIFLAILKKKSSGIGDGFDRCGYELSTSDADFDSNDEDLFRSNKYALTHFVSSDGNSILTSSNLNVEFDEEVIPEDGFENIQPYRKTTKPRGNIEIEFCKYYRRAVIVMFPNHLFLQILKKNGALSVDIDLIFLNEAEKYQGLAKNEKSESILLAWARILLSWNHGKSINVIKAIIAMENLELIKILFSRCITLNDTSIYILENMCEKYGWETFSSEIPTMFKKLSAKIAVHLLGQVIGTTVLQKGKRKICHDVFEIILDKCKDKMHSHSAWYVQLSSLEESMKERRDDQDVLLSICRLAERISYDVIEFAKTMSLVVFVPVLLRLVADTTKKLTHHWLDIAQYFLEMMEEEAAKPSIVPNWQRNEKTSCSCVDCLKLNVFLACDTESIKLKMGKGRRRHLHEELNNMEYISHKTDRGGIGEILVITKTSRSGSDNLEKQNFSKKNLENIRVIMP